MTNNEKRQRINEEITALKSLLADTDYNALKLIEDLVVTMKSANAVNFIAKYLEWLIKAVMEFGAVIDQRIAWRARINELETELEALPEDEAPGEVADGD